MKNALCMFAWPLMHAKIVPVLNDVLSCFLVKPAELNPFAGVGIGHVLAEVVPTKGAEVLK